MPQISQKELDELLDQSSKLRALENGGVDNWEGYSESLTAYHEEKQREESLDQLVEEILVACSDDIDVDPAGPGTGVALRVEPSIIKNLIKAWAKS